MTICRCRPWFGCAWSGGRAISGLAWSSLALHTWI